MQRSISTARLLTRSITRSNKLTFNQLRYKSTSAAATKQSNNQSNDQSDDVTVNQVFIQSTDPAVDPSVGSAKLDPNDVPVPNPGSPTVKAAFKAASQSMNQSVNLSHRDVQAAYSSIKQFVQRSPCDYSTRLSGMTKMNVYLKKEHLSITGSYKERGALNRLLQLSGAEKAKGVICSSAGNHAQAVAYHSTRLGIDSIIVMPVNAPHVKVARVKEFGGHVVQAGESFAQAFDAARTIAQEQGRTFIHAFNDPAVIAGQGTVAMEIIEQNPYVDAVVVPVGGGGLIAGMALFLKQLNPRIKIYGVESAAMPGMAQSLAAHKLVSVPKRATMADGIAIENVGAIAFDIIERLVDKIVTVDEDEMAAAVLTLLEVEKTVVEASGAAALAAIQTGKLPELQGQNVVLALTGSNIDMSLLGRIIEKGLVKSGRLARIHVTIPDVPGQLAKVLSIIHECRANVKDVEHERAFLLGNVGLTQPIITMETRDFEHVNEVTQSLKSHGFEYTSIVTPTS